MKGTKERRQRGITLIALIITIIVMLILVSVTIAMAVNGGLFDYAGKATSETKDAIKDEQWLANGGIQIGDVYYTIDEYLSQVSENNGSRIKLSYKVTPAEDNLSAVITVNAKMLGGLIKGYEEYEAWALKKLEGKTDEQIEKIFVDGHNFLAHAYGTMPTVSDIEEYISVIGTDFANGAFSDVEGMLEFFGEMVYGDAEYFKSLGELAIDMLQVYPAEYEYWDDYHMWAKIQLRGKTNEEIEQIFVDGQNWNNENEGWGNPTFANIEQFVAYWSETMDDGNYEDLDGMLDYYGFNSLADLAIDFMNVYPEKWFEQEGKLYDTVLHIMDPSGETWWETNTVEYTVYGDGEYTFIATNEPGTESNSVTVKIDKFGYTINSKGEKFSHVYEKTETYTDGSGDIAVIPKGFSVGMSDGINTVKNGLVIRDEKGNEFVWIPVLADLGGYYTSGTDYYEPKELVDGLISSGDYHGVIDCQDYLNYLYGDDYYAYPGDFKYAKEYTEMVQHVNEHDGFYIGRYETTIDNNGNIGSQYNTEVLTTYTTYTNNSTTYHYRWYGLYYAQKNANVTGNGTDVQTAMIYGILYDEAIQFIRDQYNKGNTAAYDVDETHPAWHSNSNGHTRVVNSAQANVGDVALNIWDLESNAFEFTQEAKSGNFRVYRGGFYFDANESASARQATGPGTANKSYSTRLALYVL